MPIWRKWLDFTKGHGKFLSKWDERDIFWEEEVTLSKLTYKLHTFLIKFGGIFLNLSNDSKLFIWKNLMISQNFYF